MCGQSTVILTTNAKCIRVNPKSTKKAHLRSHARDCRHVVAGTDKQIAELTKLQPRQPRVDTFRVLEISKVYVIISKSLNTTYYKEAELSEGWPEFAPIIFNLCQCSHSLNVKALLMEHHTLLSCTVLLQNISRHQFSIQHND